MSSKSKDGKPIAEARGYFDQSKFADSMKREAIDNPLGGHYTYVDLGSGLSRAFSGFKRITSYVNPFAIQQGSTAEKIGFTPSFNSKWFIPSPLTNNVSYGRLGPSHYDAQNQANFSPPDPSHAVQPLETFGNMHISHEPIPLACVRPLQKLYRCRMINGDEKCKQEENILLAQCPNPVLAEMRNQKLTAAQHRLIQLADYKKAIEVSEYNRGRSIAQVPSNADASWGTRAHLRPDTLWADERYANVTSEEIEAAKQRKGEMQKRLEARLNPQIQKVPHFDSNKQYVPHDNVPVYAK